MAAKLTRLTHKVAIQQHLVVESCTICSSRSRRPVLKLLDTPSYICGYPPYLEDIPSATWGYGLINTTQILVSFLLCLIFFLFLEAARKIHDSSNTVVGPGKQKKTTSHRDKCSISEAFQILAICVDSIIKLTRMRETKKEIIMEQTLSFRSCIHHWIFVIIYTRHYIYDDNADHSMKDS